MKLFNLFLALIFTSIFISCSSGQNIKEENEVENQSEDSVALEDDNEYENDESINEDDYSKDTIEEQDDEVAQNSDMPIEEQNTNPISMQGGNVIDYTVKKGDTLMLIAFEQYGDYSKWRDIRNQNPDLNSFENLTEGQILKITEPNEEFSWRPEGAPYLIKSNDTLQTISQDVYSTTRKWMSIYKHNQPLIKNPDVIYAGFTIYYLEDGNYNRVPANN